MPLNIGDLQSKAIEKVYVKETNLQTFKQDVIEESKSKTVLLYFYSPVDSDSQKFAMLLEKYVRLADGKALLVKANVEELRPVAMQLGIRSVPTTLVFSKGAMADGFAGALPEQQLKMLMQAVIGKDALSLDELIKQAKDFLDAGETQTALEYFTKVLEKDESNPQAFAGMIRCFIASGDLNAAKDLAEGLEDSLKHPDLEAAKTALKVALAAKGAPAPAELETKLKANPDDLQLRFDYATALFAANRPAEAMDELLTIIQKDRQWNEDKARQQLFEYFKVLGQMHPITVEKRRRLSSLLFS